MSGRIFRRAWVKTTPKAMKTVRCYLDKKGGEGIVAHCRICGGGSALNAAVPRLSVGDEILVMKFDNYWHCTTTFMLSKEG